MKSKVLLFTACMSCTLYTSEQPPPEPAPHTNTAASILDTAHDILKSTAGTVKSILSVSKTVFKRARQEATYFGQEIQSFLRSEQDIIAKQPADEIAQNYHAIIIKITLDGLTPNEKDSLAHVIKNTNNPTPLYKALDSIDHLRTTCTSDIIFVQGLQIRTTESPTLAETPSICTLTFRLTQPKKLYEWVNMIQECLDFLRNSNTIKQETSSHYTALCKLLTYAHTHRLLHDIILT